MTKSNTNNLGLLSLRLLALFFVIGLTVIIYINRGQINKFEAYGYPGIFLITLLANSTVFLPAPGIAIVFTLGSVLNPFWVALVASAGGALGEISGYLAGFSGQEIIEKINIYKKVEPFVRRYGGVAVLIFAAIPNPFFDLAGISAGGLKMSFHRFLFFCWIGQLIKMTCFSIAGYYSINWIVGK
ncbi:MAG: VTT domain-containing protein [Chloroflexota bacterium]